MLERKRNIALAMYRLVIVFIGWVGLPTSIMDTHVYRHLQDCSAGVQVNFRDEQCKLRGSKWKALDESKQLSVVWYSCQLIATTSTSMQCSQVAS